MVFPVHSLDNPDGKCSFPNGTLRAVSGVLLCLILLSAGFCGTAFAVSSDGVFNHEHNAAYALSVTDDAYYCSLCDLAAKVNALPAAADITVDNALDVELALIAIDQLKYKVFSINDEEYYETWLSLLNEVGTSGYGVPTPSQYFNASDAVLEKKGSLVKVVIEKKYMPVDGAAVNAEDATVTFSLVNEHGNTQILTLSTVNTFNSYSANVYSEVIEDSTLTGWSYVLYLKPGEYTLTEISDSGAVLADGTPFVTGSTMYAVNGGPVTSGNGVTFVVEEAETPRVVVQNFYDPKDVFISVVDANGNCIEGTEIQILNSDGVKVDNWTSTTASHKFDNWSPFTKYTLYVTKASPGCIIPDNTTFTLYADGTINTGDTTADTSGDDTLLVRLTKIGNLTIQLDAPDTMGEAKFTVTISPVIEGTYSGIVFTNGVGTVFISPGSSKVIENLPSGIGYTVSYENIDGYVMNSQSGSTGSLDTDSTAKFTYVATKYSISFNANGGVGEMATQDFVYGEEKNLTSNNFTRTGYTFVGWSTLSGGSVVYSDEQPVKNLTINANIALYANWTANIYNVTFDSNGGSGSMAEQTFTYDESQQLRENTFTRSGYTFAGWNTDAAGSGTAYSDKDDVQNLTTVSDGTVTFYAQWTPVPSSGGSAPSTPEEIFIPSSTSSSSVSAEPEAVETITIIFDTNDGSGLVIKQIGEAGKQLILKENSFIRDGYVFKGWAATPDGSAVYSNGQSIVPEGSITLYAVWEEIPVNEPETENNIPVWAVVLGAGIMVILVLAGVFLARRR